VNHQELEFTPMTILELPNRVYATVLLELPRCPVCHYPMVHRRSRYPSPDQWPNYYRLDQTAQVKAASWRWRSDMRDGNGQFMCETCAGADKGTFTCFICKQERPTSQLHQTYGDAEVSTDHTCKLCYETLPAKQWDEAEEKLHEKHRYDFA
jgi:hypothetical protein